MQQNPANEVFVIFHGLWAFEVEGEDIIRAHTPYDEDHRVAAGYLDITEHGEKCTQIGTGKLDNIPPGEAELVGVKASRKPKNFDRKLNVVIEYGEFVIPSLRYCVIKLPMPKRIHSVRRITVPSEPEYPFADTDGEKLKVKKVSMVQVFVYDIEDRPDIRPPGSIRLKEESGYPSKLHVFAEPEERHRAFHGRIAYTRMAEMFGLKIVPIAALSTKPNNSGVPGLYDNDTIGLSDRLSHSMFLGESGSNCDALIIDKTRSKP